MATVGGTGNHAPEGVLVGILAQNDAHLLVGFLLLVGIGVLARHQLVELLQNIRLQEVVQISHEVDRSAQLAVVQDRL